MFLGGQEKKDDVEDAMAAAGLSDGEEGCFAGTDRDAQGEERSRTGKTML